MQADLIHAINRLGMHFPPTFFDISVHLITLLVAQIKALGPILLHQMFSLERLMSVLRKIGYKDEPFIWAKDVVQVFYAKM